MPAVEIFGLDARKFNRSDLIHCMPAVELFGLEAIAFIHSDLVHSVGAGPGEITWRAEPGSHDFTISNFTIDETWRLLSLASIVDTGATYALIGAAVQATWGGHNLILRKPDEGHGWARWNSRTVYEPADHLELVSVGLNSSREIQYQGTSGAGWQIINLCVRGWIIPS